MPPTFTMFDLVDYTFAYSIRRGDLHSQQISLFKQKLNLCHLFLGQPCIAIFTTGTVRVITPLRHHVLIIIVECSKPKVVRVDTISHVTAMADT